MEIEENHTYYVGEDKLLVHNEYDLKNLVKIYDDYAKGITDSNLKASFNETLDAIKKSGNEELLKEFDSNLKDIKSDNVDDLKNLLGETNGKLGKGFEGVSKADEMAIAKGTPKTWEEFLAVNSGRSVEEASSSYIKLIEGQSPWPENFVPQQKILKPGDTFQMALDSTQPVTSPGSFATFDNIPNVDYVRNNLAVKSDWKVDCSKVVTYRVKQGVELTVLEGPVGPQIDINADKYLSGGGTQIQMLLDRSVDKMDYLEVVSIRSIN